MARYRFALRPRWILSHVFVAACIITFILCGFWQLRRLHDRRASNAVIAAREQDSPVDIATVLPLHATDDQVDQQQYRMITVTGTYDVADQVLIKGETNDNSPGFWVVTPLVRDDGTAVAVTRGWIPMEFGDSDKASPDLYPAPSGTVTVHGFIEPTQTATGIEVTDPPDGHLAQLSRVDVARLQKQASVPLYPVWVALVTQQPPQAGGAVSMPEVIPPPVLDDGPHLNYAGQWFIFATLTIIVYPLLLRRTARNKERDRAQAEWAAAHPDLVDADGIPLVSESELAALRGSASPETGTAATGDASSPSDTLV
jgi:surfeit locus 1 family protein